MKSLACEKIVRADVGEYSQIRAKVLLSQQQKKLSNCFATRNLNLALASWKKVLEMLKQLVNLIKDRQIHPNKINCVTYLKKYRKYKEIWPQTCQLNSSAQCTYCTHTVGQAVCVCVCVCVCERERENTFFLFVCCTFWCLDDRGRRLPYKALWLPLFQMQMQCIFHGGFEQN